MASGCDDKFDIGENIVPNSDFLNTQITDTVEIFMYTEKAPRERTDNPLYLLLGSYTDPVFGLSESSFITQVLQATYPNFDETTVLDSICLVLPLVQDDYYYGESDFSLNLSVYKVTDTLFTSKYYYSDANPDDYTSYEELGSGDAKLTNIEYIKYLDDEQTQIDTMYDTLAISLRLDDSFGQELLDNNEDFFSYGKFTEIFKGIYVKNNTTNSAIYKIDYNVPSTTSNFGMVIFYKNEGDTESQKYVLPINSSSARFNIYNHDYSTSLFYDQLQNPGTIVDDVAYIQSMAGTTVRMEIPGLKNFDSVVVQKAELIIKNAPTTVYGDFDPLEKIWFAGYDTTGTIVYFNDFLSSSYEGAEIDSDDSYSFFVTRIVQDLIAGIYDDQEFSIYLTELNAGEDFKRSVITTGQNQEPSKLVITYTKY